MIPTCVIVLCLSLAPDLQAALDARLAGGPPAAPAMQHALAERMGWVAVSPRGVRVAGRNAAVRDLDPADLAGEHTGDTGVWHYAAVGGQGPDPLRVRAPLPRGARDVVVHRRVEPGLWLRVDAPVTVSGGMAEFQAAYPGRFVWSAPPAGGDAEKGAIYRTPPPSRDPARKEKWRLYREFPEACVGPYPLVLFHGLGTDRWDEFREWARHSPEAAAFRARYQVWNYFHPLGGINTAIGFDPDCPAFEETVVAHLHRFLRAAEAEGVETGGMRYFFPDLPIAFIGNSQGTLKIRAFMVNFPEYGDRVSAVISLGGANTGSPWATPEWLRHTASRLGPGKPNLLEAVLAVGFSTNYFSTSVQTDLDSGWQNHDAAGGWGIPYREFTAWTPERGRERRVLSPRDANRDDARELPEYPRDDTFEPAAPLDTFCGTPDRVTPAARGELYSDRIFLYAGYIRRGRDWLPTLAQALRGAQAAPLSLFENTGLRLTHTLFGFVASEGADWPLGVYRLGDGFVPIQSQLMLDGRETDLPYETTTLFGWKVPAFPLRPNWEVIHAHTLGDPAKIRVFPGWSHLDTVTGRYNRRTGASPLFRKVAEDLLAVLPE